MPSPDHIVEVALLILGSYLAGCTLGYAARRLWRAFRAARAAPLLTPLAPPPVEATPAPRPSAARRLARLAGEDAETAAPPAPPVSPARRPFALLAPQGGVPDDLKKIKGIGPKTESKLHALGIYHHAQIAAWSRDDIAWLEGRVAGKGRIGREQWVEQARLLATAPAAAA